VKRAKRAEFIPDVIWVNREDGWMVPVNRADDPETWLKLVDGDEAIVTQVDDGTDEYDGRGVIATSSSSAPSVMDKMLDLLDVKEGMDVLEIGTGTGYNAALLAERAAPGHVTTIEVDPGIAEHARQTLRRIGYSTVTVVTGDGALGYAQQAPYDRVIATAAALEVPHAWVKQTRPGGRIVLPLAGSFERQAFLCLTVCDDGTGTARGRFDGGAAFMRLRGQRDDEARWGENEDDAQITTTRLHPREPFTEFEAGFAFGARFPGCVTGWRKQHDGTKILRLSHFDSGSWATLTPGTDGEHEVCQYGPRRLWDELEAAHRWWTEAGRPDHTRFGVTVAPEGQTFWLDDPGRVVSPQ
jgi:protein-L-isoaspartate(D-aspartate) O-methyltransferase